jgi:hypothetical protein
LRAPGAFPSRIRSEMLSDRRPPLGERRFWGTWRVSVANPLENALRSSFSMGRTTFCEDLARSRRGSGRKCSQIVVLHWQKDVLRAPGAFPSRIRSKMLSDRRPPLGKRRFESTWRDPVANRLEDALRSSFSIRLTTSSEHLARFRRESARKCPQIVVRH